MLMRSRLAVLGAFGWTLAACASSRTGEVMVAPPVAASRDPGPASADSTPPPAFSDAEWRRIALQQPWVDHAAQAHALPPNLINGVIWVESRFQPRAKSPAGARGLMQLMPATASALARSMGKHRATSYDPEFNVAAGSLYLKKMLDRYDGDVRLALAAYNAGAGNVDKWIGRNGLPPASEHYVTLVLDAQRRFDAWQRPTIAPDTMMAKAQTEDPDPEATQPLDIVPDPPVRYDLDRVESTYVPTIEPEPPLADTPYPPPERPAPKPKLFLDKEIADGATNDTPATEAPATDLPSVLD